MEPAYYSVAELLGLSDKDSSTVAYARVSSQDQKADLDRQKAVLEAYCAANGWKFEIVSDLGSGMNYRKKGLQQVLEMILRRRIQRLVLTHKDRLLRFGADLVLALCEHQGVEVVVINQGEQPSFEQELVRDVIEIITVFSGPPLRREVPQDQTDARRCEVGNPRVHRPVTRSHRIALDPTDVQATAMARAAGYARVTWNWGVAETRRALDAKERGATAHQRFRPVFNAVKDDLSRGAGSSPRTPRRTPSSTWAWRGPGSGRTARA